MLSQNSEVKGLYKVRYFLGVAGVGGLVVGVLGGGFNPSPINPMPSTLFIVFVGLVWVEAVVYALRNFVEGFFYHIAYARRGGGINHHIG